MAKKTTYPSGETKAAVKKLESFYKLGLEMQQQLHRDAGQRYYRRGEFERVGENYGLSAEMCRRYVRFVERYTPSDLERLCKQCFEFDGYLGFQVLVKLFPVRPKRRRDRIQKMAIREGFSARMLIAYLKENPLDDREISLIDLNRRGRLPAACQSLEDLIFELRADAAKWTRIVDLLDSGTTSSGGIDASTKSITADDVGKKLMVELRQFVRSLSALADYEIVD